MNSVSYDQLQIGPVGPLGPDLFRDMAGKGHVASHASSQPPKAAKFGCVSAN